MQSSNYSKYQANQIQILFVELSVIFKKIWKNDINLYKRVVKEKASRLKWKLVMRENDNL